eukprot:2784000-Prymnesium_polylepis.1
MWFPPHLPPPPSPPSYPPLSPEMCSIESRFDPLLAPRIDVTSPPHGATDTSTSWVSNTGLGHVQGAAYLYRPGYGQAQTFALVQGDSTIATTNVASYSDSKPAQAVQAVVATPTLYFTDSLSLSADELLYRTVRIVYLLLDEDHRPNVAPIATSLKLAGTASGVAHSACGTAQTASTHH